MLDGLLGRGFTVKCKSLIKMIRARIEVVRRRAEAKQKFLKEDLGKLLSNGLDINAYGRTEEFLAGKDLLSSYDFVEQSCEYIVKQLSRMQKQGECPEECREAVASLMFAAARFSDMPELRDLRDTFQQRYGNCLEAFVNQKFVEKLSSRLPPTEKRCQVLKDIASEYAIKWDSRGFERRMATPSIVPQVDVHKADIVKQKPGLQGNIWRKDEILDHHTPRRNGKIECTEKSHVKTGGSSSQGDDGILFRERPQLTKNKHSYPIDKGDTELKVGNSNTSSHGKKLDNNIHAGYMKPSNDIHNPRKGAIKDILLSENEEFSPSRAENQGKTKNVSYAIPPPYVKSKDNNNIPRPPYVKQTEDKPRQTRDSMHAGSGAAHIESDHLDREKQFAEPSRAKNHGSHGKELDYHQDEKIQIPLPKPRSIRRKHHKSSSSSSKDHSRKGLQILFDDELHHRKDDEEKMIDKLLIHYSKKPTSYDVAKLRKKLPGQKLTDFGESSVDGSRDAVFPLPSRSVSLPHEQTASSSPEKKKVFARANSFQADNQARHVHPKLPDYDDLAARFAALKGR